MSHGGLSSGMQMDFRVFDEQKIPCSSRQGGHHNGEDLGQSEAHVNGPVKVRIVGRPQPEHDGVRSRNLV